MTAGGIVISKLMDVTMIDFGDLAVLDGTVIEAIGKLLYPLVDEQAIKKAVFDMSRVRMLSSQMLGVLITFEKKMATIHGQFVICGLRPELQKVFRITQLDKVFKFAEKEDEALRMLGAFIKNK